MEPGSRVGALWWNLGMPPASTTLTDARVPLSVEHAEAVLALADAAGWSDGSAPLSEQFVLSVPARLTEGVAHVVALVGDTVVGYAQVRAEGGGAAPSAELVVAPNRRRLGIGTSLAGALPPDARLWSHGAGTSAGVATSFAASLGLVPVRRLHVMGRSLKHGPAWPTPAVPRGYAVRSFEPGRDEQAWLDLNAAAFAHHPEQGSLRLPDLEQRMAQRWWDPAGLILVVDADEPDTLAASHWTKVDPPDGVVGEVYVVAVSPQRQGQGLGRLVTALGLAHLHSLGLERVMLYVDEENVAAVHTYTALGFTDLEVHQQFARP